MENRGYALDDVVFTPQKGGRHNANKSFNRLGGVVFTPQKGGRHNRNSRNRLICSVVFTPQKGGRHNHSHGLRVEKQLFLPLKKEVDTTDCLFSSHFMGVS